MGFNSLVSAGSSQIREMYALERDAWTRALYDDLTPQVTFPPKGEESEALGQGTTQLVLQQKVNEIMRGIIPFIDLADNLMDFRNPPSSSPHSLPAGFHLLQKNSCVFWHDQLPQYILKTVGNDPGAWNDKRSYLTSKEDLNGSVPLARALRKVIKECALDRLYVPKKYLLSLPIETWKTTKSWKRVVDAYPHFNIPERYRYIVAVQKMDLTNKDETKARIDNMNPEEQKALLRQLFELYYRSGYQNAHHWNFAFAKSGPHAGKLIIYDTEPVGLVEAHQASFETDPNVRQIELNCAEYAMKEALGAERGLLFDQVIKQEVFDEFKSKIENDRQKFNRAKPILSYVLPMLPVVPLAASLIFQKVYPI